MNIEWFIKGIAILRARYLFILFIGSIYSLFFPVIFNHKIKLIVAMNILKVYGIYTKFFNLNEHGKIIRLVDHIKCKLGGNKLMECKQFIHDTVPVYDLHNTLVSIVIPTRDHIQDLLIPCVDSICNRSTYTNYEVVIVDNGSSDESKVMLWDYVKSSTCTIRIIDYGMDEYNYAAIHNYAIPHCYGDYIVMLNNDTSIIEPSWIEQLVGPIISDHKIGIVGAKLLFADNRIQHCGVEYSSAAKSFVHVYSHECDCAMGTNEYKLYPSLTGACIAFRYDTFMMLGGFDSNLACAYNDTDLCMNFRKNGYRVLYSPYARLYHYESKTRGYDTTYSKQMLEYVERLYFLQKWGKFVHVPC